MNGNSPSSKTRNRGECSTKESLLAQMPEMLRWTGGHDVLRRIYDGYVDQLGNDLGHALRRLVDEDPTSADLVVRAVRDASEEGLLRVLTAPETSFRLLHPRAYSVREVGSYLYRCFRAEAAREGRPVCLKKDTWTALGDACMGPNGAVTQVQPLCGLIALDLDSPNIQNIGLIGRRRNTVSVAIKDRVSTLLKLEEALRKIYTINISIAEAVILSIKVLVLQCDPDDNVFGSSSCQEYIGRAVITNPHTPIVNEVRLAEALVHEAVHSLLYMQLQSDPWGLGDFPGGPEPTLVSPWTSNRLPLSAFLHACFVWYALVHFWGLASQSAAFAPGAVAAPMARAAIGFRSLPLLSLLDHPSRRLVYPVVRDAIDAMQTSVLDAMREIHF